MSAAQMNETMAPFMMFYSFFNVLYNIERQLLGNLVKDKDTSSRCACVHRDGAADDYREHL